MKTMSAMFILAMAILWHVATPLQEPQKPNAAVASWVLQEKALHSLSLGEYEMEFHAPVFLVDSNSVFMIGKGESKRLTQYRKDPTVDTRVSVSYDGRLTLHCSDWRPNCYNVEDMNVTALNSVAPRI